MFILLSMGFQSAARFWLEWIPGPGTAGSAVVGSRFSPRGGDLVRARANSVYWLWDLGSNSDPGSDTNYKIIM